MRKLFSCLLIASISILCFAGCASSSSSGYSDTYNGSSEYRKTVDDISRMTGDSHYEVDRKINAMTRAINGD